MICEHTVSKHHAIILLPKNLYKFRGSKRENKRQFPQEVSKMIKKKDIQEMIWKYLHRGA